MEIFRFHKWIESVGFFETLEELVTKLANQFSFNFDEPLTPSLYFETKKAFKEEHALDITPKLAHWFSERFFENLELRDESKTYGELLMRMAYQFTEIVNPWVQFLASFVKTAMDKAEEYGIHEIHIISRDATPLYPIAIELQNRGFWRGILKLIECNREMFDIPGVFNINNDTGVKEAQVPFGAATSDLRQRPIFKYLSELYGHGNEVMWLETGFYGTLVKKVFDLGFRNLQPFFLSSCNPNIPGYGNIIISFINLKMKRISYDFNYLLGDELESIPKLYKRVRIESQKNGSPIILVDPVAPSYAICAMATYWIFQKIVKTINIETVDPLKEIMKLHRLWQDGLDCRGQLPFVLADCIPGWENGLMFLQKEFNLGPSSPWSLDIYGI